MAPSLSLISVISSLLFTSIIAKDYNHYVSTSSGQNVNLYAASNDTIYSPDLNTKLTMQNDGNLVLRHRNSHTDTWIQQPSFQSNTHFQSTPSTVFAIQTDGNCVIYESSVAESNEKYKWKTNTFLQGVHPYIFYVENLGHAYLVDINNDIIWSTIMATTPTSSPTGLAPCYTQGPCYDGYVDQTHGNYYNWACGAYCPGGEYTDVTCGCACIQEQDVTEYQQNCASPTSSQAVAPPTYAKFEPDTSTFFERSRSKIISWIHPKQDDEPIATDAPDMVRIDTTDIGEKGKVEDMKGAGMLYVFGLLIVGCIGIMCCVVRKGIKSSLNSVDREEGDQFDEGATTETQATFVVF